MTIRAATVNELAYFRTNGQHSQIYLAFPSPAIVFKARVNQPTIGTDMVVFVTYDTVTVGAYASVLEGMTMLVGSSDGAYNLGICRIRKAATSTKLFIGEESEVKFADNMYLTVIDEYGLWAKHKYVQSGSTHEDFMDFDVNYTTQHETLDPVPILGPDQVLWYQGILATHPGNSISTQFDASESYCLSSAGAKTYLWTAATGTIDNNAIANPTIHFHSAGTHRVSCKVTIDGKFTTGRRLVMIYDNNNLPISDFKLNSCSGDYDSGGWNFKVTMYDNADLAYVRDRAKVILFARDWYGDIADVTGLSPKEISIGQVAGCENIISNGWIAKEDINMDIEGGTVAFTAYGPQYWLGQMYGFISGLEYSSTAPTEWNFMKDLTVDRGLWDLLHWRSTATIVMDCKLTGDLKLIPTMESSSVGSLWEQIKSQSFETLLAHPCCDRYGRLFIEISGNLIPMNDRVSVPFTNIMTVEAYDRTEEINVERITVKPVSQVDLSGVWFNGSTGYALRALANGHIVERYGTPEVLDKVLMENQTHANELASLLLAQRNNQYPSMGINMPENMRMVDICPRQQITIVTTTDLNPREISISNNIFPRRVSFSFNENAKNITVQIDGEPEVTSVGLAITGEIPILTEAPSDIWLPPIGFVPWYPNPMPMDWKRPLPKVEPDPATCLDGDGVTGPFFLFWDKGGIIGDAGTVGLNTARAWMPCTIRSATADEPSVFIFTFSNVGMSYCFLHFYAIDGGGTRLATGIMSQDIPVGFPNGMPDAHMITVTVTFSLPGALTVAGFELTIDNGLDSSPIGAAHDHMIPANRHGATWLYPGGATLTLLYDNMAAGGYMKVAYGGSCADPPDVLGDIVQWQVWLTAIAGSVGKTYIRNLTDNLAQKADHTVLVKDTLYLMDNGPLPANPVSWHDEFPPHVASSIAGDMEIFYLATLTTWRQIGLGNIVAYNLCA